MEVMYVFFASVYHGYLANFLHIIFIVLCLSFS